MKSFYLKEQTLGEELTKLDLNLVENKTESQKKNRSKSRGNYSESEDSVAEDLEPVSSKLAKFKIESPTLATPFGNSLRSKPSRKGSQTPSNDRRHSKSQKNKAYPEDGSHTTASILRQDVSRFSDLINHVEDNNHLQVPKKHSRGARKSLEERRKHPRRKQSEQILHHTHHQPPVRKKSDQTYHSRRESEQTPKSEHKTSERKSSFHKILDSHANQHHKSGTKLSSQFKQIEEPGTPTFKS